MFRFLVLLVSVLGVVSIHAHDRSGEIEPLASEQVERALMVAETFAKGVDPNNREKASNFLDYLHSDWPGDPIQAEHQKVTILDKAGYGAEEWASLFWAEDMAAILAAHQANSYPVTPRPIREIEKVLLTLPTVPLDAEDQRIRTELLKELTHAQVSIDNRITVEEYAERIEALKHLVKVGKSQ